MQPRRPTSWTGEGCWPRVRHAALRTIWDLAPRICKEFRLARRLGFLRGAAQPRYHEDQRERQQHHGQLQHQAL